MSCTNDTSNGCFHQLTYINDFDDCEQSFYDTSERSESNCFADFFNNLKEADNLRGLQNLRMSDEIHPVSIGYWKNRRKQPKFMHEFYLLGDTIGRGSYGKVKDCIDIRTMKRYAIKIVHRMNIKRIPGGMKHVESEIRLMATLCHDNIVKLVDEFHELESECRCLVMEFCLGSIHDLQSNGILESSNQFRCLPEWQTRRYFVQIIDGLQYLHDQGIIHKDMKPGNFLLTEHDCVKITDFGVSERLEMFQTHSFISGGQTTPAIQPPELALGAPNICGYKLDIYGTGVSLYFMLCGRVPFSNPNFLSIFDEIASGEYTIPEWVSLAASDLIRHMMWKDVDERFDIKKVKEHRWYLERGEEIGARVDPKLHLIYCGRDRTRENVYRLSTGQWSVTGSNNGGAELPAIMPLTVTTRLRTYYDWPLADDEQRWDTEEEPFIMMGEDCNGMADVKGNNGQVLSSYNIDNEMFNDARRPYAGDCPMSVSLSQSAFSQRQIIPRDDLEHNTIPKTASATRNSGATTNDKKTSLKSKLKFGGKIPTRCTQS